MFESSCNNEYMAMQPLGDEAYMRMALQLAGQAQGQTGINPTVGCVVVKDGRIVGLGAHLQRGAPHAEVHALTMAGAAAAGSTVYVTLEPCSHYGRTPPCVDRLIADNVGKVVVAAVDPNPRVSGSGIAKLRERGIEVVSGVLAEEAAQLNEAYNKYIASGLPFVTLKTASTLDGKIAASTGDSKWITSEQSREFVHTLRHRHQGIMVGVNTVIADDPSLTTRLSVPGLNPVRIVVDSRLRIPEQAKVVQQDGDRTIVVTTESAPADKEARLAGNGVAVIRCGQGPRVDLRQAMKRIGEREIGSILLEGGGRLNGAMLEAGLIDKIMLFYAPKIIAGTGPSSFEFAGFPAMRQAIGLDRVKLEPLGRDFCVIGYPQYGTEGGTA